MNEQKEKLAKDLAYLQMNTTINQEIIDDFKNLINNNIIINVDKLKSLLRTSYRYDDLSKGFEYTAALLPYSICTFKEPTPDIHDKFIEMVKNDFIRYLEEKCGENDQTI